jgi:hypothetical protein
MSSLQAIPIELQRHIVQYLDIETLKAFRLSYRSASTIAAWELFHTVFLRFNDESAGRLQQVLADDKLRPMVKRIILDGDIEEEKEEDEYENDERQDTPWSLAISTIAGFPSLREVELRFDDELSKWYSWSDREARTKYREDYMKLVFASLQSAQLVDSLAIRNMYDATCICAGECSKSHNDSDDPGAIAKDGHCLCTDKHFVALRSRLKKLAFLIATGYDSAAPENSISMGPVHECFNDGLLNLWLKPTQPLLTHLTLYSDMYWGVYPFIDVRGLCFSNLKSLVLGNFTIAHDWQIDWIASHGETLEELFLDDCPIVYALNLSDYDAQDNGWEQYSTKLVETRWSSVFPLFQQRLKKLRHFAIGNGQWSYGAEKAFECRYDLPARIEKWRYVSYDYGQGPIPWNEDDVGKNHITLGYGDPEVQVEVPDCEVEDQAALDALLKALEYSKDGKRES